ncbi:ethanolaminephosphotransferase 1-like [Artemia franciscana]|uniref:ethanolaminephosphotransferase 1-like n=1 Tax=Artemia franciscana TaxID=6661 RepID=UPI0032DA27EE
MLDYEYLSEQQLHGFSKYKYNSIDSSPLSQYVMHPFWNSVVKICPTWIAPNTLTFFGFLLTAANFFILTHYDYSYWASSSVKTDIPPIPQWIWLIIAANHFLAHTLDGIDGKQARRTGTSGPLGELFDHGLDAWTSFFIPATLYSVFGRGDYGIPSMRFYACVCCVLFTFIASHWEKYNTGVLFLPWGYDVSQLGIFAVYLLTFFYGHMFWKFSSMNGIPSGVVFELMMWSGSLITSLPMTFWNLYVSWQNGTGKNRGLVGSLRPLLGTAILFFVATIWAVCSPVGILDEDTRCFVYMVGVVFANITCRLIVSQMSDTECDLIPGIVYPVIAATALALLPACSSLPAQLWILYSLTLVTTLAHIHYGVCVVRQMCRNFGINCFRIKSQTK